MSIAQFLKETPIWVWFLLAFLLRRGFAALYDREMTVGRLFFLPVLFLIWGAYSVITEIELGGLSLTFMVAGIIAGATLGYTIWRSQPTLRDSTNAGMIIRAGTPLTLGLIVFAFSTKFILVSSVYMHPELRSTASFCILFGGLTGFIDGVFWGGTLRLFIPWYMKK